MTGRLEVSRCAGTDRGQTDGYSVNYYAGVVCTYGRGLSRDCTGASTGDRRASATRNTVTLGTNNETFA